MTQRLVLWNVPADKLPKRMGDIGTVNLDRSGLLSELPELEKALDGGGRILSHSSSSLGADRVVISFIVDV